MKKIFLYLFFALLVVSCGSRKTVSERPHTKLVFRTLTSNFSGRNSYTVQGILNDAEDFLGLPYKLGGATKEGLDCSGLVVIVYNQNKVKMPRRSQDQALQGRKVEVSEARPGDLLFFDTGGYGSVTHVGIVKEIKYRGEITFIHASTSKGVMISSLNDSYWNKAFLFVRRVL
jgi:cell wall-associated NlpC family hydrolase